MIDLFLKRRFFADDYTVGTLSIGGQRFSDTLEDKTRDLNKDGDLDDDGEDKVYGKTAIPYGRYRVSIVLWKKHDLYVPYLHNVTAFTGILIHSGASAKDTEGCILVGLNTTIGRLTKSREFARKLTILIQQYIIAGHEVYINIH